MFEQETHKVDTSEELKSVKEAALLDLKASQVKKMMRIKFNKKAVTTRHIRYVMNKIKGPDTKKEDLEVYLEMIVEEGGSVEVLQDKEKIRVITIQTAEMRRAYNGASPDIVGLDSTFNFSNTGYKMSAFCYINPVSNSGEIAQLAFIADEGEEAFAFVFNTFKKSCKKNPAAFIVDKDFSEIKMLNSVFPDSIVTLCLFHVLKWIKQLVSTARREDGTMNVNLEKKDRIMTAFRGLVYAHSSVICSDNLKVFIVEIEGIEVRVGNGEKSYYVNFSEYYAKNWASCEAMWMTHLRRRIPGMQDEMTNNRLERMWRSMKTHLKQMSTGLMSISGAVLHLVKFAEERIKEKYTWDKRHSCRFYHSDPKVRQEYLDAAVEMNDRGMLKFKTSVESMISRWDCMEVQEGGFDVKEKFQNLPKREKFVNNDENNNETSDDEEESADKLEFKIYKTNINQCNCAWSCRTGAPCRHILLCRKSLNLPMFDKSLFNQCFLKERNQDLVMDLQEDQLGQTEELPIRDDIEDDIYVDMDEKIMTKNEKFKIIFPISERIVDAILRCGTKRVKRYERELENILENALEGRSLLDKRDMVEVEKESVQDVDREKVQPDQDDAKEKEDSIQEAVKEEKIQVKVKNKFNLNWHSGTKLSKVGRPRESKVKFRKKTSLKSKPSNSKLKKNTADHKPIQSPSQIICSFPPHPSKPRRFAVDVADYKCLAMKSFLSNSVVDFFIRHLQPSGPAGQTVWLITNFLAQQMAGSWWQSPSLLSQVQDAKLYEPGGCELVTMAWVEKSHFFLIVAICGDPDKIFILESIGGYPEPRGADILRNFLAQIRVRNKLDPVEAVTIAPEVPRQSPGSNDCGVHLLENISRIKENPLQFIARAQIDNLKDWYPTASLVKRRSELAGTIRRLGEDQRLPGGLHEGEGPLQLPSLVMVRKMC